MDPPAVQSGARMSWVGHTGPVLALPSQGSAGLRASLRSVLTTYVWVALSRRVALVGGRWIGVAAHVMLRVPSRQVRVRLVECEVLGEVLLELMRLLLHVVMTLSSLLFLVPIVLMLMVSLWLPIIELRYMLLVSGGLRP
jgi:hypothetical protein